jgi:hypothetical protein
MSTINELFARLHEAGHHDERDRRDLNEFMAEERALLSLQSHFVQRWERWTARNGNRLALALGTGAVQSITNGRRVS